MMVLADEVGTPEDIDKLFRYSFQSKGAPCELMDDVGLQTVCNIDDHYIKERGNIPTYPVEFICKLYVEKGNLTTMTGKDLYDHTKGSGNPEAAKKVSLRSQLIGAWELVEYSAHSESDPSSEVYPMGRNVQGIIMYTPDGYMSAPLQIPGQPDFKVTDLDGGSRADLAQAGKKYLAYTGLFYLDESGNKPMVKHHMTNCSFPNWMGNRQRRMVSIAKEGGNKFLTLGPEGATMAMDEMKVTTLKWRRLEDNQSPTPPHTN